MLFSSTVPSAPSTGELRNSHTHALRTERCSRNKTMLLSIKLITELAEEVHGLAQATKKTKDPSDVRPNGHVKFA